MTEIKNKNDIENSVYDLCQILQSEIADETTKNRVVEILEKHLNFYYQKFYEIFKADDIYGEINAKEFSNLIYVVNSELKNLYFKTQNNEVRNEILSLIENILKKQLELSSQEFNSILDSASKSIIYFQKVVFEFNILKEILDFELKEQNSKRIEKICFGLYQRDFQIVDNLKIYKIASDYFLSFINPLLKAEQSFLIKEFFTKDLLNYPLMRQYIGYSLEQNFIHAYDLNNFINCEMYDKTYYEIEDSIKEKYQDLVYRYEINDQNISDTIDDIKDFLESKVIKDKELFSTYLDHIKGHLYTEQQHSILMQTSFKVLARLYDENQVEEIRHIIKEPISKHGMSQSIVIFFPHGHYYHYKQISLFINLVFKLLDESYRGRATVNVKPIINLYLAYFLKREWNELKQWSSNDLVDIFINEQSANKMSKIVSYTKDYLLTWIDYFRQAFLCENEQSKKDIIQHLDKFAQLIYQKPFTQCKNEVQSRIEELEIFYNKIIEEAKKKHDELLYKTEFDDNKVNTFKDIFRSNYDNDFPNLFRILNFELCSSFQKLTDQQLQYDLREWGKEFITKNDLYSPRSMNSRLITKSLRPIQKYLLKLINDSVEDLTPKELQDKSLNEFINSLIESHKFNSETCLALYYPSKLTTEEHSLLFQRRNSHIDSQKIKSMNQSEHKFIRQHLYSKDQKITIPVINPQLEILNNYLIIIDKNTLPKMQVTQKAYDNFKKDKSIFNQELLDIVIEENPVNYKEVLVKYRPNFNFSKTDECFGFKINLKEFLNNHQKKDQETEEL